MQLIDQHNKTVEIRSGAENFSKDITNLHSDQKKLVNYLFKEKIITVKQRTYLNSVIKNIASNRTCAIANPLYTSRRR